MMSDNDVGWEVSVTCTGNNNWRWIVYHKKSKFARSADLVASGNVPTEQMARKMAAFALANAPVEPSEPPELA